MNNAIHFAGLPRAGAQGRSSGADPATPVEPAAGDVPMMGRRWSDVAGGAQAPAEPDAPWDMAQQWPNLVAALSEQSVESSNLVLRALNYLVGAGRLRRSEAKALSDAMQQLRGTSLRAQQITRLAGGQARQARERVDLAELVRHGLRERAQELEAAGVAITTDLESVDVVLDAPAGLGLLNGIVDWALGFSEQLHFSLAPAPWPALAQLKVRVPTPPPAPAPHPGGVGWTVRPRGRRLNDGLHWMLLRQIAASSSLGVTRTREDGAAVLTVEFPNTFHASEGMACRELTDADGAAAASLRDTWVLVLAKDDGVREEALHALRKMGIAAVAATDPAQARAAIGDTRPDVLVAGYDIAADQLAGFRREVFGAEDRCPLVEITRDLPSFQLGGFDRFETPKVGREQIASELPPTVLFELVKVV